MYLNETGYAELFPVAHDVIKLESAKAHAIRRALGDLSAAFKRCEASHCSLTIGGSYNEKFPDVSIEDMAAHVQMNYETQQRKRRELWEKENARNDAGVLTFFIR